MAAAALGAGRPRARDAVDIDRTVYVLARLLDVSQLRRRTLPVSQRTPSQTRPDQTAAAAAGVVQQPRCSHRLAVAQLSAQARLISGPIVSAQLASTQTVSRPHKLSH